MIRWSRWVEIDLWALRVNFRALRALLSPKIAILPVIKSEAYGHGLLEVARVLAEEGAYGFGLSEPEEALRLRKAGLALPILLLSGFEKDWLPDIYQLRIIPVVVSVEMLEELGKFLQRKGLSMEFHLKINTGMNRFGIDPEELPRVFEILSKNPHLKLSGVMSHLACAEKPDDPLTQEQQRCFLEVKQVILSQGLKPRFFHLANSAGLIFLRGALGNMVRPGISLYGSYPSFKARAYVKLKPVMTFKARILQVRSLKKGAALGYGPLYRAPSERRVALVPVGYDDGYLRSLSHKGFAWLRGRRVPVVGAISMRCLTLDVSEIENEILPGEEVILLGGPKEEVPVDELAELAGTISYEILCAIGRRNQRVYRDV